MPFSDMWQKCQITLQHTRPCYAKSSSRSVDPQIFHGNVHQADHVPNGPTNSAATTTMFPLRLCGGKPLVAVTRERRYGPSRLRVNDVDDDYSSVQHVVVARCFRQLQVQQIGFLSHWDSHTVLSLKTVDIYCLGPYCIRWSGSGGIKTYLGGQLAFFGALMLLVGSSGH